MSSWQYFLAFSGLLAVVLGGTEVDQTDDGSSGSIKFSTPDLHDDEAHSPWMPDELRCDACAAVSYQIWNKFHTYNQKRKSLKYNLPESDVLDLMESVCGNSKTWEGYGMKEVNKVHRLSGDGLDTKDVPGVTAGGGRWPGRMQDMCEQYAGDLGEATIYEEYKKDPKNKKSFENYLCRGKGIRGECVSRKKAKRDEL